MARRRLPGILFPFLLLALAVGGWSVWWNVLAQRLVVGLDDAAKDLRNAGWRVRYAEPRVTGWPFRARLVLDDVSVVMPSGHGLRSERLLAESLAYQPDRWVILAPQGLSLGRAAKGWTAVTGDALRASVSSLDRSPPRVVVEFAGARFQAEQGSEPFPIASAGRLVLNLIPGGGDGQTAGLLLDLQDAQPREGGVLQRMTESQPFHLRAEAEVGEAYRLRGRTWPEALGAWASNGGALTEVRTEATAGDDHIRGQSARLAVDAGGRLTGELALDMRGGTAPLEGLAEAPGVDPRAAMAVRLGVQLTSGLRGDTSLTFRFRDGRTVVGPVDLGPAPKVF